MFSLLEKLTERRLFAGLLVYYQRIDLRNSQQREAQGQVGGKGVELPYRLLGHPSPSISLRVLMEARLITSLAGGKEFNR